MMAIERIASNQELQTYHKPIEYTPDNVKFWEELSKTLMEEGKGSLLSKAKKFIEEECVKQIDNTNWKVEPIKSYNKKTYNISMTYKGFLCTCQGFLKKQLEYEEGRSATKPICSHIISVHQFCFLEERKNEKR